MSKLNNNIGLIVCVVLLILMSLSCQIKSIYNNFFSVESNLKISSNMNNFVNTINNNENIVNNNAKNILNKSNNEIVIKDNLMNNKNNFRNIMKNNKQALDRFYNVDSSGLNRSSDIEYQNYCVNNRSLCPNEHAEVPATCPNNEPVPKFSDEELHDIYSYVYLDMLLAEAADREHKDSHHFYK